MKYTVEVGFKTNGKAAVVCPYHQEKTPSCAIDIARKTFHCFGCGAEGTARANENGTWEIDDGSSAKDFSNSRSDESFLSVSRSIADYRNAHQEITNEEIAYALLQTCACIDDSDNWFQFLREALNECINNENAE